MDPMLANTLVTAGSTLLGLIVGVFAEPVKIRMTSGARIRQERIVKCERFIAAVKSFYSEMTPMILPAMTNSNEGGKAVAIEEIRNAMRLGIVRTSDAESGIYLYGPDKLVEAAGEVLKPLGELVVHLATGSPEEVDIGEVACKFSEIETKIETFSKLARTELR